LHRVAEMMKRSPAQPDHEQVVRDDCHSRRRHADPILPVEHVQRFLLPSSSVEPSTGDAPRSLFHASAPTARNVEQAAMIMTEVPERTRNMSIEASTAAAAYARVTGTWEPNARAQTWYACRKCGRHIASTSKMRK